MSKCRMSTKTTNEKEKFGSNKKTGPRMNYEWIGETISKKIRLNKWKKQKKSN